MYKLILVLLTLCCFQQAFAEACPSVGDIKKAALHGFQAYDIDDNERLSSKRLSRFVSNVEQFILAEWQDSHNKKGEIHCYYRDKDGSQMETYLMKAELKPGNGHHWYQVSGSMHCAAGTSDCLFENAILKQPQLARK